MIAVAQLVPLLRVSVISLANQETLDLSLLENVRSHCVILLFFKIILGVAIDGESFVACQ